jgi:tetratricopeptide (TPR) repeat protein
MSLNNLAETYWAAEYTANAIRLEVNLADAIPLLEANVADYERLLGPDHPNTLMSRNNLAAAYWAAERTTDAIPPLEANLADYERLLGPDHPNTLMSRNNLAEIYRAAERTTDAIRLHEANLPRLERVLGPEHLNTITGRSNLAETYKTARQPDTPPTHRRWDLGHKRTL